MNLIGFPYLITTFINYDQMALFHLSRESSPQHYITYSLLMISFRCCFHSCSCLPAVSTAVMFIQVQSTTHHAARKPFKTFLLQVTEKWADSNQLMLIHAHRLLSTPQRRKHKAQTCCLSPAPILKRNKPQQTATDTFHRRIKTSKTVRKLRKCTCKSWEKIGFERAHNIKP